MKSWNLREGRKVPLNIAHRGSSVRAPQNTMAAFELALQDGADGIELDVHLSSDGVPVVIHNFTVDATTDGTGAVNDLTLAELKRLDAGSWFAPEFTGQRIPTLEEVLTTIDSRLLVNVEIKSTRIANTGLEWSVVEVVRRCGPSDRILFSSFNPIALWRCKQLAPDIAVGLVYAGDLSLPLRRAWLAPLVRPEAHHPHHAMVDDRYMARARARGVAVNVWTVDDPDEMQRLIDLGVGGFFTNVPDVLHHILQTQD
ncbi:MAG: glycerophosphodiester phosphodiesterase [Chloroflexi bacterium]|nr:glycerophosphodiester phosphodiesterase [Chloroflexota bacterium]